MIAPQPSDLSRARSEGYRTSVQRLGYFSEIGYCAKRDWVDAAKWYGRPLQQATKALPDHLAT